MNFFIPSRKTISGRQHQRRETMSNALTLISGEYKYVDADTAIQEGTCFFCGWRLKSHPRDRHGNVPINRHHRIKSVFEKVYHKVTGRSFPQATTNLYWVGYGCHVEFHNKWDPWPRELTREAYQKGDRLKSLLVSFLQMMRPINFGRHLRTFPAALPEQKSYFAILCKVDPAPA